MTAHQTEIHRQQEAAQAVRSRLMSPSEWVRRPELDRIKWALQRETEKAQDALTELETLRKRDMGHQAELRKLELDVADRDARILSQMDRICALENLGFTDGANKKRVADIVAEVLANFPGVLWSEIIGLRRTKNLIEPRKLCMYEVHRQRPDLSYPQIGRLFGGRDHTTIMHSVKQVEAKAAEGREGA